MIGYAILFLLGFIFGALTVVIFGSVINSAELKAKEELPDAPPRPANSQERAKAHNKFLDIIGGGKPDNVVTHYGDDGEVCVSAMVRDCKTLSYCHPDESGLDITVRPSITRRDHTFVMVMNNNAVKSKGTFKHTERPND